MNPRKNRTRRTPAKPPSSKPKPAAAPAAKKKSGTAPKGKQPAASKAKRKAAPKPKAKPTTKAARTAARSPSQRAPVQQPEVSTPPANDAIPPSIRPSPPENTAVAATAPKIVPGPSVDRKEPSTGSSPSALIEKLKIPPILLEGDPLPPPPQPEPTKADSTPSSPSIAETKAPMAPPPAVAPAAPEPDPLPEPPVEPVRPSPAPAPQLRTELPDSYGTGQLFATALDPHSLHVHWDVSPAQLREYNTRSADGHLALRVFEKDSEREIIPPLHLPRDSNSSFVRVNVPDRSFRIELGYYLTDRAWVRIASTVASTPPEKAAPKADLVFATVPEEKPIEQVLDVVHAAVSDRIPADEAILQLQASGQAGFAPFATPFQAAPEDQTELSHALEFIEGGNLNSAVWSRPPGPGRLPGLPGVSGVPNVTDVQAISSFQLPTVPEISRAPSQISEQLLQLPISSAELAQERPPEAARETAFWMSVNAELIIYGATDPNARVSIGDRDIHLRPDGTFSFRFLFPDGNFELPILAISPDGDDLRGALLRFSRASAYQGSVQPHGQDPALKVPAPENAT